MVSLVKSPMPAKIPRLVVYMPPEVKARLEVVASKERRSLSQMVLLMVEKELERLEADQPEGK